MTYRILTPEERRRIRSRVTHSRDSVKIYLVPGMSPPKIEGKPYWKTIFSAHGGRFKKILYTPSTRKILVGIGWIRPEQSECSPYNRD